MSREEAYAVVQRNAMPVWEGKGDFLSFLKNDSEVTQAIPETELAAFFSVEPHLAHVDQIFHRVFGESAPLSQRS